MTTAGERNGGRRAPCCTSAMAFRTAACSDGGDVVEHADAVVEVSDDGGLHRYTVVDGGGISINVEIRSVAVAL
jgi:hypothetical protein